MALPPFVTAATSNFTFEMDGDVAAYTPEVQAKLASQLAAQVGVQANQVLLAPPRIAITGQVEVADFPPGSEADVRAGIAAYLAAPPPAATNVTALPGKPAPSRRR